MKLKSTMKHRRLKSRLLNSMLTVALRFSYLLISKDNVLKAETVSYDGNGYSIVQGFTETIMTTGTTNLSHNIIKHHNTLTVTFDKIVSGKILLHIKFCTNPRNTLVGVIGGNVYLYSIGTNDLSFYVEFNGVNRIVVELENLEDYVGNFTTNYANWVKTYPTLNTHTISNLVEMTASEVQTMLNIKNSIYNIESYVDGLETVLMSIDTSNSQISNHLQTVHNDLTNMLNTLHADNQNIINTINNLSSQTDIDKINNFNTKLDVINNIETNLINDLDLEIGLTDNALEYYTNRINNGVVHNASKIPLNALKSLIAVDTQWSSLGIVLNNILVFIMFAVLLGVIIG